jgi:hypothetical protein
MPDGILPAPPTGGAFWRYLDFAEIIKFLGDLVGALLAGLLQSPSATAPSAGSLLAKHSFY